MRFPDNQTTWRLGMVAIGVLGLLGSLVVTAIIWPKPWVEPRMASGPNTDAGHPESNPVVHDQHLVWARLSFSAPPAGTIATTTAAPVREVRLVSLLMRKGQPTAAIETRPGRSLAFLNVGEERDGVRVVTIKEKSVEVLVDGAARRLEARR